MIGKKLLGKHNVFKTYEEFEDYSFNQREYNYEQNIKRLRKRWEEENAPIPTRLADLMHFNETLHNTPPERPESNLRNEIDKYIDKLNNERSKAKREYIEKFMIENNLTQEEFIENYYLVNEIKSYTNPFIEKWRIEKKKTFYTFKQAIHKVLDNNVYIDFYIDDFSVEEDLFYHLADRGFYEEDLRRFKELYQNEVHKYLPDEITAYEFTYEKETNQVKLKVYYVHWSVEDFEDRNNTFEIIIH